MTAPRPNVLFSSTSQWNVGDEFILRGILQACADAGIALNPVLYNRNPAVSTPWRPVLAWPPAPVVPPENSAQLTDGDPVDYVIFAGTPEWAGGPRSDRLLRFIRQRRLRCAFLGVGLGAAQALEGDAAHVLRDHADVFVARDTFAFEAARPHLPAHRQSCPAILCCPHGRARTTVRRIGVVLQAAQTLWQSVPVAVRDYLVDQFRLLAAHYEVHALAHYLDDLSLARSLGLPCRYSFRSEDYPALYEDCDLVVTARVHGAGLAASLGIPAILVSHDGRAETGRGFGAEIVAAGTPLLPLVRQTDWAARSHEVLRLKETARAFYRATLAGIPALR